MTPLHSRFNRLRWILGHADPSVGLQGREMEGLTAKMECRQTRNSAAPERRFAGRPIGLSSRLQREPATPEQIWLSPSGTPVKLPVVVDLVDINEAGQVNWSVEAAVGLRNGQPSLLRICIAAGEHAPSGLDTLLLQEQFRWNTPLEIVTRIVPRIIERGGDPYEIDYPHEGFPDVSQPRPGHRLTSEFLTDVARDYLMAEPPYAQTLAQHYNVSPRTVVSWIEKARQRGILEGGAKGRKDRTLKRRPDLPADSVVSATTTEP